MPSDPCKVIMKAILSEKGFDPSQWSTGPRLAEFFKTLIPYLGRAKGTLVKKWLQHKKLRMKLVFASFEKLKPYMKPNTFTAEMKQDLNTIFTLLLHPDTSPSYRSQAISLFIFFVFAFDDNDQFKFFENVLFLVVPFGKLKGNEGFSKEFQSRLPSSAFPIIEKGAEETDTTAAMHALSIWLDAIAENWKTRTDLCASLFYKTVLAPLYPNLATKVGLSTDSPRIRDTIDPEVLALLSRFLLNFSQEGRNLTELISSQAYAEMLIGICNAFAMSGKIQFVDVVVKFVLRLVEDPSVSDVLLSYSKDVFLSICDIISTVTSVGVRNKCVNDEMWKRVEYLLTTYFQIMLAKFPSEGIVNEVKSLFKKHQNNKQMISVLMLSFLNCLVCLDGKDQGLWSCMVDFVASDSVCATMAGRYGQYLATVIFPDAYQFDRDKLSDTAHIILAKMARFKMEGPNMFLVTHLDEILETPSDFVDQNLAMPLVGEFESDLDVDCIYLPSLLNTNGIIEKCERFLESLDSYSSLEDRSRREYTFAPIRTFCAQLIRLRDFPPGITYKLDIVCQLCLQRLVFAVLGQDDQGIRESALEILSLLFEASQLSLLLDAKALSQIYTVAAAGLTSTSVHAVETSFKLALELVQGEYTGASVLLNLMVTVIESGLLPISKDVVAFLGSSPVFDSGADLPKPIADFVRALHTKDKAAFNPQILSRPLGNLRQRAGECMLKLPKEWQLLLNGITTLAINEITHDNPNSVLLDSIANLFIESLNDCCVECTDSLSTLSILHLKHEKLFSDFQMKIILAILQQLENMTVTRETNVFYTRLIILMTETVIQMREIIKETDIYQRFVSRLIQVSRSESSDPIQQAIHYSLRMLSMYYGVYPFPHGDLFPIAAEKVKSVEDVVNLHYLDSGTLWRLRKDSETGSVVVATQTNVGPFQWRFNEFNPFSDKSSAEQFTFPTLEDPNDKKPDGPTQFAMKMNKSVTQLEEFLSTELKPDAIPDDDIDTLVAEIKGQRKANSPSFVKSQTREQTRERRPKVARTEMASIPVICGLVDGSHESIRPVTVGQTNALQIMSTNKKTYRYCFKIGVVYAGNGIEEQNAVLGTQMEDTTPHFREFLHGIGWPIKLPTHIGYDGGLHLTASQNGTSSVYFADFCNETMFHVSPLFPFDVQSDQQLNKKRHIGNDHVHIIWNENTKFYHPGTITSQFNQCHVIIHPLARKGLFSVSVVNKPELKWFGPLCGTTVVDKRALPVLVRSTVQSAMKQIYRDVNGQPWKVPQQEIEALLMAVIDGQRVYENSRESSVFELMAAPFSGSSEKIEMQSHGMPLRTIKSMARCSPTRVPRESYKSVPIGTTLANMMKRGDQG